MKRIRNPYFNAAVISAISFLYGAVFILTSGHLEFERILDHGQTLSGAFWNGWSVFLRQGNLKYVGGGFIVAAICIVIVSFIRKKDYDEYQAGILTMSFMVTGLVLLLLFPIALLLVLSDPNYAVEAVLFLIVLHWSIFLLTSLIHAVKWCRG